ncbi:MAG: hypothetical protein IT454_15525 [Planctomycetes bacterium]|nr:hypothetical protein [Planctomycetota bacterium]
MLQLNSSPRRPAQRVFAAATSLAVLAGGALTALVCAGALDARGLAQPAQDPPPPNDRPALSFGAADKGDSRVRVSSPAKGLVSYSLADRKISLKWSWTSTGPRPDQHSVQEESVAFWPTEAIGMRTDRIAVAGVRRERVVLELWTLGTSPLPAPRIDADTGQYRYGELTLPIKEREELLNEPLAQLGPAAVLFFNPQAPATFTDSLYVQFATSKDVYRVDWRESDRVRVSTKVASPQPAPNLIVEPRLADPFRIRWSADHPQHGFVYVLAPLPGGPQPIDGLVLLDLDRDGALDNTLRLDGTAWNAGGWGDAANYVTMY